MVILKLKNFYDFVFCFELIYVSMLTDTAQLLSAFMTGKYGLVFIQVIITVGRFWTLWEESGFPKPVENWWIIQYVKASSSGFAS